MTRALCLFFFFFACVASAAAAATIAARAAFGAGAAIGAANALFAALFRLDDVGDGAADDQSDDNDCNNIRKAHVILPIRP